MIGNHISHVFFMVDREEVETRDYKRVMDVVRWLESLPDRGYQRLVFNFSGYDHVVEEIFEIQDIRDWVNGLYTKCPHFLYFVTTDNNARVNVLTPYADVEAIFFGEKLSADEWVNKRGVKDLDELPEQILHINLSKAKHKQVVNSLRKFGFKYKVQDRTLEVEHWLSQFSN